MDEKLISRINELSRKKKTVGLTDDEAVEQQELRRQYLDAFKKSFRTQLDSIKLVDEDEDENSGNKILH